MGNTHMKQKVVISALAGMILIPGSAVPVKAAEEPEQGQPLLPAAGFLPAGNLCRSAGFRCHPPGKTL